MAFYARSQEARRSHSMHKLALVMFLHFLYVAGQNIVFALLGLMNGHLTCMATSHAWPDSLIGIS